MGKGSPPKKSTTVGEKRKDAAILKLQKGKMSSSMKI
jgi:hypothetical protein